MPIMPLDTSDVKHIFENAMTSLNERYESRKLLFAKVSQLTSTCSKSTAETIEKGVKYVQS